MQKHKLRNELWMFFKGCGSLRDDVRGVPVKKGDCINIKLDEWHQYVAKEATVILEIQYGTLCCEGDIERKIDNGGF